VLRVGERVLRDSLREPLFQRAPAQVKLPQWPAVGDQLLADRLAQVLRSARMDQKTGMLSLTTNQDHSLCPRDRLERGPDQLSRASGLDGDRALPSQVAELIVKGDTPARDDDHTAADSFYF
jgi:hypothetical protein